MTGRSRRGPVCLTFTFRMVSFLGSVSPQWTSRTLGFGGVRPPVVESKTCLPHRSSPLPLYLDFQE